MKLTIEKRNKAVSAVKDSLKYISLTAKSRDEAFNRMRDVLPSEIKMGYGGSHIWASNANNERLLIVEI